MKKILLSLIVLLGCISSSDARVKIEKPNPDFDVKIARCEYTSGTLYIDLVMTSYGAEIKRTFVGPSERNSVTMAYDDEGNRYSKITMGEPGGAMKSWFNFTLPKDIPVKLRVEIDGVDEVASKLKLLQLGLEIYGSMGVADKPIKIYNLEWAK